MSLHNLPNELLSCVAEALSSETDINAFVQANRHTYCTLDPYLYRHNLQQSGSSALLWAARHGQEKTAAKLLGERRNHQAKCDYGTPLCVAAEMGHEEIVKLLLEEGIDVDAQGGEYGNALQAASCGGHKQIVKLVLQKGADTTKRSNKGWTPLYSAARNGHLDGVMLLVEKGVDTSVSSNTGCAPLNVAAE